MGEGQECKFIPCVIIIILALDMFSHAVLLSGSGWDFFTFPEFPFLCVLKFEIVTEVAKVSTLTS